MDEKKSNVVPIRPDVQIPEQSNVVPFVAPHIFDIEPDQVLKGALGKYDEVVVVGRYDDGTVVYASSSGYLPNILWLLHRAVHEVHTQADANDDDDGPPLLTG